MTGDNRTSIHLPGLAPATRGQSETSNTATEYSSVYIFVSSPTRGLKAKRLEPNSRSFQPIPSLMKVRVWMKAKEGKACKTKAWNVGLESQHQSWLFVREDVEIIHTSVSLKLFSTPQWATLNWNRKVFQTIGCWLWESEWKGMC